MSDHSNNQPIRSHLLAEKLARLRNYEHEDVLEQIIAEPRLVEACWFLQWVSRPENYPGGLRKFAVEFVEASADLIGPEALRKAGRGPYDDHTLRAIVDSPSYLGGQSWEGIPSELLDDVEDWSDIIPSRTGRLTAKQRRESTARLDQEFFAKQCVRFAISGLPDYFRSLCEVPRVGFLPTKSYQNGGAPWCFAEIGTALLRFLDTWAAREQAKIAETVITREIFKWLKVSLETRQPIEIEGNSRFGKTEAVRAFAAMRPGAIRVVETPPNGGVGDLIRELARAFGVEVPVRQQGPHLRETVEYVLAHSGLGAIFDESQFLLPTNFSRNTAPARLNLVRRAIIDKRIAAVFVHTPQSYHSAKKRFVRATSYAMEQWDERTLKRRLPDKIGEEDLLAIARIHFEGVSDKVLSYVVNECAPTERNYVSDVAKIAALAKYNAHDAGRKAVKLEDIEAAIADVLPPAARTIAEAVQSAPQATLPPSRRGAAGRLQTPCNSTSGADMSAPSRITFDSENPVGLVPASGG